MTNLEIIKLLKKYKTHLLKLGSHIEYDYQETRSFLNRNRALVQRILTSARTLRFIDVAPPPLIGGYIMQNVNPMDLIINPTYGLEIIGHPFRND